MKTSFFIFTLIILSLLKVNAEQKNDNEPLVKSIDGKVVCKAKEGLIIECDKISYNPPGSFEKRADKMSRNGLYVGKAPDAPEKRQKSLDKYNKEHFEYEKRTVQGKVLLKDFSGSEKLADGDTVKADVVDAGVINDYHLVAGGGVAESLHSYSADVSRFEKKIIKTPQTTTPCSTCKGRGTVNNPDRNKMGSVKCTKCKGVGYFIDERATETFVWVKKTDTLKP